MLAFNYLIYNTDYRVLLTGGEFSRTTEEFYGEIAEKSFDNLNIDIAFAATNGVFDNNITTANSIEGSIQRVAFAHSRKNALLLTALNLTVQMCTPSIPYQMWTI